MHASCRSDYVGDLPAKPKGKVKINLPGIQEGTYSMEIYKVGYRPNDAYTTYLDLGKPNN